LPAKTKKLLPSLASEGVPDAGESRGAVAVTVAWMLLALSCAAAQVVALAIWLIARSVTIPGQRPNALLLVVSTLGFVAILSGILVLVLTPLVYRIRVACPPLTITAVTIAIALFPLILAAILAIAPEAASNRGRPAPNPEPPTPNLEP